MLVVLNKSDHNASVIEPESGEVIRTIDVGHCPHEAASFPAPGQIGAGEGVGGAGIIAVANYGDRERPGHTISLIETRGWSVTKTIDLVDFHRPHGMWFIDDGSRLVVTAEVEGKLLVVDMERGIVESAIDTGAEISHMLAVSPDEGSAYVANIGSGSISVIDLAGRTRRAIVPTGEGAEGIAAHPSRDEVWVTNRVADTISVISTETLEVVDEFACPAFPIRVAFLPGQAGRDSEAALVSCAKSGDVAVIDVASRSVIRRIAMVEELVDSDEIKGRLFADTFDTSPVPIGILIRPGGTRAFIANSNADAVTVLDLERWVVAGRLRAGREPDGLAWVESR